MAEEMRRGAADSAGDEADQIIEEILSSHIDPIGNCLSFREERPQDNSPAVRMQLSSPRSPIPSGAPSFKCTDIYLGGPSLALGCTRSPLDPRFCSNLSCVNCDHIVLRFVDSRWDSDVDYLFLRNNYPNTVGAKLHKARGWCAFCCQCKFCEESEDRRLDPYHTTWVCRGH